MKIACSKCGNATEGIRGEFLAYFCFALTIPMIFLFGFSMVSIAGLGIYTFFVHNSSRHICKSCIIKTCPTCNKKLQSKNYCKKCKIHVCQNCGSHQIKKPNSWLKTLVLIITVPILILIILIAGFINVTWMILFALVLLHFTSGKCNYCNKRYGPEYF